MVVSNMFLFSPRNLGKCSNLTFAYFSNGWFQTNHRLEKDDGTKQLGE